MSKKQIRGAKFKYGWKKLKKEFEAYLKECEEHTVAYPSNSGKVVFYPKPRVPTVEKFCARLGIWPTTMEEWRKPEFPRDRVGKYDPDEYEDVENYEYNIKQLHKTANHIWHTIYSYKMDAIVNGDGNVGGLIFDAKVHYNKNDKQVVEHHGGSMIEVEVVRNNNAGNARDNKDTD